MLDLTSKTGIIGSVGRSVANVLGNRCSVLLSYGGTAVFLGVSPFTVNEERAVCAGNVGSCWHKSRHSLFPPRSSDITPRPGLPSGNEG